MNQENVAGVAIDKKLAAFERDEQKAGLSIDQKLAKFDAEDKPDWTMPLVDIQYDNQYTGRVDTQKVGQSKARQFESGEWNPGADQRQIGIVESLGNIRLQEKIPLIGGVFEAKRISDVMTAFDTLSSGVKRETTYTHPYSMDGLSQDVPLTDEDREPHKQIIESYLKEVEDLERRGTSFGADVTKILVDMVPFVTEFVVSGGAASIGREAVKKAAGKYLKKYGKGKMVKAAVSVAGGLAAGATRLPLFAGSIIKNSEYNTKQGQGDAEAAFKAIGDTYIEIISESSGEGLLALGAKIPVLNRLFKGWSKSTGGSRVEFLKKMSNKVGYHGILGEIGEERLGDQLRAVTGVQDFGLDGDDNTVLNRMFAAIPSLKQLLTEGVAFAFPGVARAGAMAIAEDLDNPGKKAFEKVTSENPFSEGQAAEIARTTPGRTIEAEPQTVKGKLESRTYMLSEKGAKLLKTIKSKAYELLTNKSQPSRGDFKKLGIPGQWSAAERAELAAVVQSHAGVLETLPAPTEAPTGPSITDHGQGDSIYNEKGKGIDADDPTGRRKDAVYPKPTVFGQETDTESLSALDEPGVIPAEFQKPPENAPVGPTHIDTRSGRKMTITPVTDQSLLDKGYPYTVTDKNGTRLIREIHPKIGPINETSVEPEDAPVKETAQTPDNLPPVRPPLPASKKWVKPKPAPKPKAEPKPVGLTEPVPEPTNKKSLSVKKPVVKESLPTGKNQTIRELNHKGAIHPGDIFRTSSGRTTTPYPKQKSQKYISQWLIDNAVMEAESRGDKWNADIFKNTQIFKAGKRQDAGYVAQADSEGLNEYLFGEQPEVPKSFLKPLIQNEEPHATEKFDKTLNDIGINRYELDHSSDWLKGHTAVKAIQFKNGDIWYGKDMSKWTTHGAMYQALEDAGYPVEDVENDSMFFDEGDLYDNIEDFKAKKASVKKVPEADEIDETTKPVKRIQGKKGATFLTDNTKVDFEYAIMDLDDLTVSHDKDGIIDPSYPQELQPRNRKDRFALKEQTEGIANILQPERLGQSSTAGNGTPLVTEEGVVVVGNNRSNAIGIRYERGDNQEYTEWLAENEESEFGAKGSGTLKKPVLVRIIKSDMDLVELAMKANQPENMNMSDTEQAVQDAKLIDDSMIAGFRPGANGDLTVQSNKGFMGKFYMKLAITERNKMIDKDGKYSRGMLNRVKLAVFQRAYGDEALLALQAEATKPSIIRMLNGLVGASGSFMRAQKADKGKDVETLASHVVAAVHAIKSAKAEGTPLSDFLEQEDMISGVIPEETALIAEILTQDKKSAKKIGVFLTSLPRDFIDRKDLEDQGGDMFDDPVDTDYSPLHIINNMLSRRAEENEKTAKSSVHGTTNKSGKKGKQNKPKRAAAKGPETDVGTDKQTPRSESLETFSDTVKKPEGMKEEMNAEVPSLDDARTPIRETNDQPPISNVDVIATIQKEMGVPIRTGRLGGRKGKSVAGTFYVKAEVIRIVRKFAGDLGVASHEAAHYLDKVGKIVENLSAKLKNEIKVLDYDKSKNRPTEGFAEWVRVYFTFGDKKAEEIAPEFYDYFVNTWLPNNPAWEKKVGSVKKLVKQWFDQGYEAQVAGHISKSKTGPKALGVSATDWVIDSTRDFLFKAYTAMKDIGFGLSYFTKETEKRGAEYDPGTSPFELFKAFNQAGPTHAQHAIENGVFSLKDMKQIGPSLRDVLKDIDPAEYDTFVQWIYARHAREVWGKNIDPGISLAAARHVYNKFKTAKWVEAAEKFTDFNNALVFMMVDSGVITKASGKAIINSYQTYIPLMRVKGSVWGKNNRGKRLVNLPDPFKKRKGSAAKIYDPFQATIERAVQFYERAAQQIVIESTVKAAEDTDGMGFLVEHVAPNFKPQSISMSDVLSALRKENIDKSTMDNLLENVDMEDLITIYKPDYFYVGNQPIARVIINGNPQLYQFDKNMFMAINGMNFYQLPYFLEATFGRFARFLKLGATGINVSFGTANPVKDQMTYLAQKEGELTWGKEAKYVLTPVEMTTTFIYSKMRELSGAKGDPIVELWERMGGPLSQRLGLETKKVQQLVTDLLADTTASRAMNLSKHPIDTARTIIGVSETGPRLAIFKSVLERHGWTKERIVKEGLPPRNVLVDALNRSHDATTDFRRAGWIGRPANRLIPYFNAPLESIDKFVRTWRDQPVRAFVMSAMLASSTVAYWAMRKDDDDYKEQPTWLKYGTWSFTDKEGKPVARIPVPFEWGWIIKGTTELICNLYQDRDPKEASKFAAQATKSMLPGMNLALVTPLAEVAFNWDLFRDMPIESQSLQSLSPGDRYGPRTTNLMREIGKYLNTSPKKIEHFVNATSGGLFNNTYGIAEKAYNGTAEPADIPGISRFMLRKDYSKSISEFYDKRTELNQKYASAKLNGEVTPALKAEVMMMRDHDKLMKSLRDELLDKQGRDNRFDIDKYMVGVSRSALGKEELERYPNLIKSKALNTVVQKIKMEFISDRLYQYTNQPSTKIEDRAAAIKAASKWLKDANMSKVEMQKMLRAEFAHRSSVPLWKVTKYRVGSSKLSPYGIRLNILDDLTG